jgi:hypothetical protein
VPTRPAPIEPEPQNALEFILPAIGTALLVILLLIAAVLLAVLIYWWWEWRGMRGLSPIARAYARLERYLALVGIRFRSEQTPEERRRQVVRGIPQAERPVTAIMRGYMNERYGPGYRHPGEAHRTAEVADKAWPDARRSILRRWVRRFQFWRRG